MNLSQRVWKYVGQYKDQLESALDVGWVRAKCRPTFTRCPGKPQRTEPLFRRVRDKRGNLVLSKARFPPRTRCLSFVTQCDYVPKSIWHTGKATFALAIPWFRCGLWDTRTIVKWLNWRYPKTFKFKGWHPQCMCYATPILMDEETFDENELGDLKAALRGTIQAIASKECSAGFKKWVKPSAKGVHPYFIKDFKEKLSRVEFIRQVQTDVLAPYRAQIEQARQQATKWGLSATYDVGQVCCRQGYCKHTKAESPPFNPKRHKWNKPMRIFAASVPNGACPHIFLTKQCAILIQRISWRKWQSWTIGA